METKLKVLFHLKRSEINSDGACPILGRITVVAATAQPRAGRTANPRSTRAQLPSSQSAGPRNTTTAQLPTKQPTGPRNATAQQHIEPTSDSHHNTVQSHTEQTATDDPRSTTAQFRTKLSVDPRKWDARAGRLRGKSDEAVRINEKLNRINALIFLRYEELLAQRGETTAQQVKNAFQGISSCMESLTEYFAAHNAEYEKHVGVDRVRGTWMAYNNSLRHLKRFIRVKYKLDDVLLRSLTPAFIDDFDFYLRYDRKLSSGTINQVVWPLGKIVRKAMSEAILFSDPFAHYERKYEASGIKHLSNEELHRLMNTQLGKSKLYLTRDMFVLSCFTGLSYADMRNLTLGNLTFEDGMHWIRTSRQKTGVDCNIPLLDIPLGIINKYRSYGAEGRLLPVPSSSTMNRNLKKNSSTLGRGQQMAVIRTPSGDYD